MPGPMIDGVATPEYIREHPPEPKPRAQPLPDILASPLLPDEGDTRTPVANVGDFGQIWEYNWRDFLDFNPYLKSKKGTLLLDLFDPKTVNVSTMMTNPSHRAFVESVERAFFRFNGDLSFDWLIEQDPEDLELLDPEFIDVEALQEAQWVRNRSLAQQHRRREAIAEQTRLNMNLRTGFRIRPGTPEWFRERDTAREAAIRKVDGAPVVRGKTPLKDLLWSGLRIGSRQWLEAAYHVGPMFSDGLTFFNTGLGGAAELGLLGLHPTQKQFQPEGARTWYELLRDNKLKTVREAQERIREAERIPDDEIAREARFVVAEDLFKQMEQEDPEQFSNLLAQGGGDRHVALGLLTAILRDQDVLGPDEQVFIDEYRQQLRGGADSLEQALKETAYQSSTTVLDILSAYHRAVPGRLLTLTAITLTDRELWESPSFREGVTQLWEKTELSDSTPSVALGIDGTVAGLALDFFGPIPFDPTVWFFGPRIAGAGARPTTAAQAAAQANGRISRVWLEDLVRIGRSPSHGEMEALALVGSLDDIGFGDKLLNLLKGVNKTLPGRRWRTASRNADEVLTTSIDELADPRLKREWDFDPLTKEVTEPGRPAMDLKVAQDIDAVGFREPLIVEVSLKNRQARLVDGYKRLVFAKNRGIQMLPVEVRLADDVLNLATAQTRLASAVGDDVARSVVDLARRMQGKTRKQWIDEAAKGGPSEELGNVFRYADSRDFVPGELLVEHSQVLPDGTQLVVQRVAQGPIRDYLMRVKGGPDAGKVVGALRVNDEAAGGLGLWVDPKFRMSALGKKKGALEAMDGRGVMDVLWDAALDPKHPVFTGENLFNFTLKSEAVSPAGAVNSMRQAQRFLERHLGADDTAGLLSGKLPEFEGVPIEGLRLPAGAKAGDVLSPRAILPEEKLFGPVEWEKMHGLLEDAMKLGASPFGTLRLLNSYQIGRSISRQLEKGGSVEDMARWLSPQNVGTYLGFTGPGAMGRISHTLVRMGAGAKAPGRQWAEEVLTRLREFRRTQAQKVQKAMDDMNGPIADLDDEIKHLEDLSGNITPPRIIEVRKPRPLELGDVEEDILRAGGERHTGPTRSVEAGLDGRRLRDELGGSFRPPGEFEAQVRQDMLDEIARLKGERAKLQAQADEVLNRPPDGAALETLLDDAFREYNIRFIGTNPGFARHVIKEGPDAGMVPWDALSAGKPGWVAERAAAKLKARPAEGKRTQFTDSVVEDMLAAGAEMDPEKVARGLLHTLNEKMGYSMPLSAYEMIAATTTSGPKFIRLSQNAFGHQVRQAWWDMHRLWVVDKVMRPATAVTVSLDEWLRIWHLGGAGAVSQYLEDRVMYMSARGVAALQPGKGLRFGARLHPSRGIHKLSPRWQERYRRLQDYPTFYKQMERQVFDTMGIGWDDIKLGTPEWYPAAERWTSDMLQDSGFRAYFRGRAEFRQWFETSVDGDRLRRMSALDVGQKKAVPISSWEDVYGMYDFLFDKVLLHKAADRGRIAALWKEAGARIDAEPTRVQSLAPEAINALQIPVRGVRRVPKGNIDRVSNWFFDALFMNPTNYRRGFLAEMVRKHEGARLDKLWASQGIEVIDDIDLDRIVGIRGAHGAVRAGLRPHLDEVALRYNKVTRGLKSELIEARVADEIDHALYSWHMSSRLGRSAAGRGVFPFGRPWVDMWGMWGREFMTRPALRGVINEKNFLNMSKIANKAVDHLPFNPRVPATLSRVAATDFEITDGFSTKPGGFQADFSPLFFLPKQGENAFLTILPGLGPIPAWLIDYVITHIADPIEDPEGYERIVGEVSQIIPPAGYQQHGLFGRWAGGGIVGTTMKLGSDSYTRLTGDNWWELDSTLGDVGTDTEIGRNVSALMADPEELADLLAADEGELDDMLLALSQEAVNKAAWGHSGELTARQMFPARLDLSAASDQVQEVWFETAKMIPELLGTHDLSQIDPNDERAMRQAADEIRRNFFDLPGWKRDLIIVEQFRNDQPNVAVNLVSQWEWTEQGRNTHPDGDAPYSFSSGRIGQPRHESLIRHKFIQNIGPTKRIKRILGVVQSAHHSLHKELYEETAREVNRLIWEQRVPEDWKNYFEGVVQAVGDELDVASVEEVWREWSRIEPELERRYNEEAGIDPDSEDAINIVLPAEFKRWGESFVGLDEERFSDKFRELTIPLVTPKMAEIAKTLGIPLVADTTRGDQLVNAVVNGFQRMEAESPVWQAIQTDYNNYRRARGGASTDAVNALERLGAGDIYGDEFRQEVNDLVRFIDKTQDMEFSLSEIYEQSVHDRIAERKEDARSRYTQLARGNPEINFGWETVWKEGFEEDFGSLDWTPPEPPPLFVEPGPLQRLEGAEPVLNPNAYQPVIKDVLDGDTLLVSREPDKMALFGQLGPIREPTYRVRLIGRNAPEIGLAPEAGNAARAELEAVLRQAVQDGEPIYLMRDPGGAVRGNTDFFGRELAWLFIGDAAWYKPEDFRPEQLSTRN